MGADFVVIQEVIYERFWTSYDFECGGSNIDHYIFVFDVYVCVTKKINEFECR